MRCIELGLVRCLLQTKLISGIPSNGIVDPTLCLSYRHRTRAVRSFACSAFRRSHVRGGGRQPTNLDDRGVLLTRIAELQVVIHSLRSA